MVKLPIAAALKNRESRSESFDEVLVSLRDVSISYPASGRGEIIAVDKVSIDVRRGEKLVILGPSGCGKSTLLTAVAGFIPVASGTIEVSGEPVVGPSMTRVMVFQDFGQLFPWRKVLGNVKWAIHRRWPKLAAEDVDKRARRFIELVGLSRQIEQFPHTLSGGQKQRCAMARAFAVSPEILLMDEPFGALDAISRERMQTELNRLWGEAEPKVTVIFVTHDVNEAVHLGHRIMVMSTGPGRLRAVIENSHVGVPPYDTAAMPLVAVLRELLREERELPA